MEFKKTQASFHAHIETFGLGNYRGNAFTTGCSPQADEFADFEDCSRSSEIFDMTDMTWLNFRDVPDYPFTRVSKYVPDCRMSGTQFLFLEEFMNTQQLIHLTQYSLLVVIIQGMLSPNTEMIDGSKLLL